MKFPQNKMGLKSKYYAVLYLEKKRRNIRLKWLTNKTRMGLKSKTIFSFKSKLFE